MLNAGEIAKEAKQYINTRPEIGNEIRDLQKSETDFFNYFITCVKENRYLIVSYILNYCFQTAKQRADFGNKQDALGNTAYHYAAENGYDEIIVILNDKRKYNGQQSFFRFTFQNNAQLKPLDICCANGQNSTFSLLWKRIGGKSQHNPVESLRHACIGGNIEIVKTIMSHPKFHNGTDKTKELIQEVTSEALNDQYGEAIKQLFEHCNEKNFKKHAASSSSDDDQPLKKIKL